MESMQEGFSQLLDDWSKEVPDLAHLFEARHIAMTDVLANSFVHYHYHEYISGMPCIDYFVLTGNV